MLILGPGACLFIFLFGFLYMDMMYNVAFALGYILAAVGFTTTLISLIRRYKRKGFIDREYVAGCGFFLLVAVGTAFIKSLA